jgi:hypothetical protein
LRSGIASQSSTAWRENRQCRPSLRPGSSPFGGERPDGLLVDLQQLGELLDSEHVRPAEL